ncbi:MAG: 16S rRNA processing protein RimM [Gemmatimonadaceae bacterium]|nr:16S rRNA processing protein RimM [Gemmatimonadaceae bacterium]
MRRAFGLKGELLVEPVTSEPGAVFAPGRRLFATRAATDGPARRSECVVAGARAFKQAWLLRVEGVGDRTAADDWRGATLSAPMDELRPPAGNEVYLHELAGMSVSDESLGPLGAVASWYELPQGIVLEVRGGEWRADVPFNDAFIASVNRADRLRTVRLPEGLAEPAAGG